MFCAYPVLMSPRRLTLAIRCALALLLTLPGLFLSHATAANPLPQDATPHGTSEVRPRLTDGTQFSGLARVRILTQGGPALAENTTDMSGKVTITDLPPGNYIVEASTPGYLTASEDVRLEMKWSFVTITLTMKPDNKDLNKSESPSA